ncbi:MAG: ABC transporter permease [Deltaproteobacteria bacterium]
MNASQITRKDLLLLYRDRRTLSVLVALPLAFISILGLSTGQLFSQAQKARTIRVAVVDADDSELSKLIISELDKIKALDVTEVPERTAAKKELAEGKTDALLYIGPGYDEKVRELDLYDLFHVDEGRLKYKLNALDIQVESGSFLANASDLVRALVFSFALKTMPQEVLKKHPNIARQITKASRDSKELLEEYAASEAETGSTVPDPPQTGPNIVYQILVPSYTVMFVFFIVNFMARSFIGERDMGTLNRLRLAPISRPGLMIGKTVPFLVISLVQTALLFLAGKVLFGMSWGPEPWLLFPVMLCTSLAATSLGLMVATLVRTEAQVSAYGNFLVLTMAGISGCMMPRTWQPELMQQVGLITPHAWALIAYNQILNEASPEFSVVLKSCEMLLAFAAGFFAVGWWRARELD